MEIDTLVDGEFRDKMAEAMMLDDEVEVMRELARRVRVETLREAKAIVDKHQFACDAAWEIEDITTTEQEAQG